MRRFCGPLLMATGVLHLVLGLVIYASPLRSIAGDGFFNAVEVKPAQYEREAAFWFMFSGGLFVALGGLVRWVLARTGTLPASLGWGLLGISKLGAILMPACGFWLVIPQSVLMIAVARQGRSPAAPVDAGSGIPTGSPGD